MRLVAKHGLQGAARVLQAYYLQRGLRPTKQTATRR